MNYGQRHENDPAELVIVCSPSLPKMMGSLHPAGALYEKPVNLLQAESQHLAFQNVLREHGVKVLDVRDILCDIGDSVRLRCALEDLAGSSLKYVNLTEESDKDSYYVSDTYKAEVLKAASPEQLVNIVLTRPTVTIQCSGRDTGYQARYEFEPLTNLVFVRDQQVTTKKGIVMAHLRSPQRQAEINVMKFCFMKLGLPVIGQVPEGGYLEGGDFFPAGDDLCFIGIGLRSDMNAVNYMMSHDLFGTHRVAVVDDRFDQSQDRMHLDCVFNLISSHCCLMFEGMMGENSPKKRLVDEYTKDLTGHYRKTREGIEFRQYLQDNGYSIIPVSAEAQLKYGCNVLNLGNGVVVAVNNDTARDIVRSPQFSGDVKWLDFSEITNMYGAVHCASQVVRRKPPMVKTSRL